LPMMCWICKPDIVSLSTCVKVVVRRFFTCMHISSAAKNSRF